ncbi:hypothetical protein A0J61_10977 [Choanephora cucurbitarum]|uniref:Uncharacterized protein n=1 Tax=Choanephora cucurbitarum TaxID=101091 RepID=A0A1C7N0U7_9FUNG|nr:hypothetical protein A0J61_10977 [Choanephora cucurbitarum]
MIQSLPREIRNLRTNTILVCLINGPKEPKTYEMNHHLRPLTKTRGKQVVKAALFLCMMDLPAQRKVAGFTSFNSINARHKCKKQFEPIVAGGKARDFTDFDVDNWTGVASTKNSSLPIMLSPADLKELQAILETKLVLASGHAVPSIARKLPIGKDFCNFKAEEWTTWLLILSPYLLAQRLTTEAHNHWMFLVKASRIFLSSSLTMSELDEAQELMKAFLVGFEAVYDDKFLITSNIHNALHLREATLDYSASPSHWLFNFEGYNQDIKRIRTNRKGCVERTYIKRFLIQVHAKDNAESLLDDILAEFKERFITGTEYSYGFEQLPPKAYLSINPKLGKLSPNVSTCLINYYNAVHCLTFVDAQFSFANPESLPVDWCATKFKNIDILGNKYTSTKASRLKNRDSKALAYH